MQELFSKIPAVFKGMPVVFIDEKLISAGVRYLPLDPPTIWNKKQIDLMNDILKQGMLYPLEVSEHGRFICSIGNQRLHILRHLGIKMAPVVIRGNAQVIKKGNSRQEFQIIKNARFISGKKRVKEKRIKNKKKK